ncbi:MAG: glutamine-hydrolyzing carbamoyl-phosphate synthase small subunit [Pseudomonadota bacterium]
MKISQGSSPKPTAVLILEDGTMVYGQGLGAQGAAVGEVCFNTAITGYQEILTDPSYAGQIITFTFPHIGNVGANDEDTENATERSAKAAAGAIIRDMATAPSNYRSQGDLSQWLERRGIVGIAGVDTRALTSLIRESGMPKGVVAHNASGEFDLDDLRSKLKSWDGLEGEDLAINVTTDAAFDSNESGWAWDEGFGALAGEQRETAPHIVVIDYGVKQNILRRLTSEGCRVSVVSAKTSAADILAMAPDGVVLSNGPGDPAATGEYATPVIKDLLAANTPLFGICLGHQMLALAAGARTKKMAQGHHGANLPVNDLASGKVEIVSMNHGFTVDGDTLPENIRETHISLFDGSNCGIALTDAPAMSVQYHPEASPGPEDSFYIFGRFVEQVKAARAA